MSEISERYQRLAAQFAARTAQADPHDWSNPTPCEDWTARELVAHVVDTQALFLGLVGRELGDVPSVDDDPHAAVLAATARVQHDLDDDALSAETFDGMFGITRFDEAVDRFASLDLVVHGWDLARSLGLDERLPDDEVTRLLQVDVPRFGDTLRTPGVCGPAIELASGASDQDRLLALLGRRP